MSSAVMMYVPCIIAGDLNIDLMKYMVHTQTTEYVNCLLVNNFVPTIVMPTRINDKSATLINHIYIILRDIIVNIT